MQSSICLKFQAENITLYLGLEGFLIVGGNKMIPGMGNRDSESGVEVCRLFHKMSEHIKTEKAPTREPFLYAIDRYSY